MYKLIIADSNKLNTDLMKQCLLNENYTILTSDTGANIMAKCQMFHPDLIILDTNFTDISGYDVCKSIKNNPATSDTLVLIMNSNETRETRLRALEAGADDFIEKSFDSLILTAKVQSLLRVKTLSDQLKDKYSELEEKNKIIEMQLEMGQKIQTSLIRELDFEFNHTRITSKYMPAFAIGGDFYEIIDVDESRFLVIMGDVSGHGISSALLTTMLKIMIKNLNHYYAVPADFLWELNRQFIEIFAHGENSMYTSVFAALVDTDKQIIKYSNAGHPAPVFINNATKSAGELSLPGTPIGMLDESIYELKMVRFQPGDLLLFHTDGLSDNLYKNNPDKFFEMLSGILLDMAPATDSQEIINIILDEFYNFKASESEKYEMDDVSIILCKL